MIRGHRGTIQVLALVTLLLSVSLAGADLTSTSSNGVAIAQNDEIIWETIGNPEYLDPHVDYESFGEWIFYNVYETLFTYLWDSIDTTPSVPLLAESLHISEDGLNYTFTLRQGVTFHDGTSFNASCVVFNLERVLAIFDTWGPAWMIAEPILGGQEIKDAAYEYGEGSSEHIAAYNEWKAANDARSGALLVLDTYIVRIRLAYPYAGFIAALTYSVGSMISPTYIMNHGGVVIGEHNTWMDEHTCGTGPYMVTRWEIDSRIVLELFGDYWRTGIHSRSGSITKVTILTNEDVNSRILNIQAGESDGCYWPTSLADQIYNGYTGDPGDGTLMSTNPNLKVWAGYPAFDVMFFGFNMRSTLNNSGVITENPFALKAFRYAASYAYDYAALIDGYLHGFGVQMQGPIPHGMFGHHDDLYKFNYNLTDAVIWWNNAMLDGLDDILANNSYTLTFYHNAGSTQRDLAMLMLKDGLEQILDQPDATQPSASLTINIEPLEWATYLTLVRERQLPIYALGWTADFADPDGYIDPFIRSDSTFARRVGLNESEGWDYETIDDLIDEAAHSLNVTHREVLYRSIQEEIVEHAAYLWIFEATSFHVEYARLNGYQYNPMYDPYFFHYWKTTESSTTTSEPTATEPPTTEPSHGLSWGVEVGDRLDFSVTNTISVEVINNNIVDLANTLRTGDDYYYIVTETPVIPPGDGRPFNIEGDTYWENGTATEFILGFEVLPVGNWSLIRELLGNGNNISETTNTFTLSDDYTSEISQISMHGEITWLKTTGELIRYLIEVTNSTTGADLGKFIIQNKNTGTSHGDFDLSEFIPIAVTVGSVAVIAIFGALIIRNRGFRPS
ncbi:MAG: ABC transporter substrate-binding protein [Candidatus Thorarchaeota archaeon]